MSSLPREVHEVLEHEYVSMYGPLPNVSVAYDADQVVDVQWVLTILRTCGLEDDDSRAAAAEKDIEIARKHLSERLNELVGVKPVKPGEEETAENRAELHRQQRESMLRLGHSPALTTFGGQLIADYDALFMEFRSEGELDAFHRKIVDEAFNGGVKQLRDRRLKRLYEKLHERAHANENRARTALCISGGGIRSATFALGVIQGLASAKILDKFDYLSTVSGGGYIGSWLSSWAKRHPHGIRGVQEDLARADSAVGKTQLQGKQPVALDERGEKLEHEPQPLRHLRDYSNYLSPRLGILSGDAWTMAALYIRNLLLNLLVLVPIFALVLAIPRAYSFLSRELVQERIAQLLPADATALRALTNQLWLIYPLLTIVFIAAAFDYIGRTRPIEFEAPDQRAEKTTDGKFFWKCVLPLTLAAITLTLFWTDILIKRDLAPPVVLIALGVITFLSMSILPFAGYYGRLRAALKYAPRMKSSADPRNESQASKFWRKSGWEAVGTLVGFLTAAGLIALLAVKVFDAPLTGFDDMIAAAAQAPAVRAVDMTPWSSLFTIFAVPAVLLVFFVQASIFVGIASVRNDDSDREWWGRAGAWLLVAAVAWAVISAITIFGPAILYRAPLIIGSLGGAAGVIAALLGFSAKTPANKKEKDDAGLTAKAGNGALSFAVPLFVIFFLATISLATTWLTQEITPIFNKSVKEIDWKQYEFDSRLESQTKRVSKQTVEVVVPGNENAKVPVEVTDESAAEPRVSMADMRTLHHYNTVYETTFWQVAWIVIVAGVAYAFSKRIGVNTFSMHALYANRLIRAYLGASRYTRKPNPFTGFDERDKLQMYDLRPELLWPSSLKDVWEFCAALNAGDKPAPPEGTDPQLHRLARYLFNQFSETAKDQVRRIAGTRDPRGIEIVVHCINAILLDEDRKPLDDAADLHLPEAFWANHKKDETPYPKAVRNRAVFDHVFGGHVTAMPRPGALVAGQGDGDDYRGSGTGAFMRQPLHIVNIALNLVSGEKLAWQQRKATSFTVSPYHSGSVFLGYRDSREYGGDDGIGLGTAVTISGAAASPNMGYHSSPFMAFLLTLFNVRLGWWLGNPGPAGTKYYKNEHPNTNLGPMLSEAIGRTNDTYEWVYLSDGGHFENLGLYEMVLRRCHYIVLSDAGCDPSYAFEDLGNAIRKIRTDMGVPIDIEEMFMLPRTPDGMLVEGRYVATATIRYTAVDGPKAKDGLLIYLKPGVYKDEYFPRDVYNYAKESKLFPHEPTSDQFFSESQFESYRALGRHAINEICCNYPDRASTSRPRIPIAKQFPNVARFAEFVEDKARAASVARPEEMIAKAIRESRPLLRR